MGTQDLPPVGEKSTSLLKKCLTLAEKDPKATVPYIRTLWNRDGTQGKELLSQIVGLKKIRVLCEKEMRWPLSKCYLPTTKLRFLCKRYMLEDEEFPFIELEKPLTSDEGVGPWAFLQSHFGVKANDDLDFYLDLLYFIRRHNSKESRGVEFPRRILELYLRIYAVCRQASDFPKARHKVR